MDRGSIETNLRYQEITRQHFNGGYFSEAVREQGTRFKELSKEDQEAFFTDAFNAVRASTEQLCADEHVDSEGILDLSDQGLGSFYITVENVAYEQPDDADPDFEVPAHVAIRVESENFNPTPQVDEQWPENPNDPLGLESTGTEVVQLDQEPDTWGEPICANPDGSFHDSSDYFGSLMIEDEIMRVLDAKETADLLLEALGYNT